MKGRQETIDRPRHAVRGGPGRISRPKLAGRIEEGLTCAHPGLGAGAVDGDSSVQDLDWLHHQAVRDGAEEFCRG